MSVAQTSTTSAALASPALFETQGSTTTINADIHSAQPIQSVEIALVSHPIQGVETNDSWTVQEVRAAVAYRGASATSKCVLDQPGKTVTDGGPLVVTAGGCASAGTLELLIVTGGDDLRSDSTATVRVNYQGGSFDLVPLTAGFPADTTRRVDLGLTSAQPIESLALAMQSHPNDVESGDSWNISQVEALTSDGDGGAPTCLINALGRTITDGVTLTLTPGGCPVSVDDAGADGSASDATADDAATE
jgi:hypothetical protein